MSLHMYVIKDWDNQLWLGQCPKNFAMDDERYHEGGDLENHHPITWAFDKLDGFNQDYIVIIDGDRPGSDFVSAYLQDEKYVAQFEKDLQNLGEKITVKVINSWES